MSEFRYPKNETIATFFRIPGKKRTFLKYLLSEDNNYVSFAQQMKVDCQVFFKYRNWFEEYIRKMHSIGDLKKLLRHMRKKIINLDEEAKDFFLSDSRAIIKRLYKKNDEWYVEILCLWSGELIVRNIETLFIHDIDRLLNVLYTIAYGKRLWDV